MSPTGLPAVHHDAPQTVLRALHTLLRLVAVRLTVLLNHLTWGRGGGGEDGGLGLEVGEGRCKGGK